MFLTIAGTEVLRVGRCIEWPRWSFHLPESGTGRGGEGGDEKGKKRRERENQVQMSTAAEQLPVAEPLFNMQLLRKHPKNQIWNSSTKSGDFWHNTKRI